MSEDISNVPRRLRRFYRHGEPVPENMERYPEKNSSRNDHPVHEGENHDENEPWMNAPRATSANKTNSTPKNPRRENARAPNTNNSSNEPKPGLFSRVLHGANKPTVTPIDHALGLHDKEKFVEKIPNMSSQAMQQKPPAPSSELPVSQRAQADIQKALQELRALAKTDTSASASASSTKSAVPTTSFHFTPAGEAPRAPESSERATQYPAENANANVSPRERAEQRRQGRTGPAPSVASSSSGPALPSSSVPDERNSPAHIRRRMGQLIDQERMDRDETPSSGNESSDEKEDEDFKSLFSENKNASKDKDKKKKKTSAEDDDDMSLGGDDDGELELFEDEK